MRVLVACEFSGVVRDAFIDKGHDAWSCDLMETEGKYTYKHIVGDALQHLDEGWDMLIAHPPCTYLCRNAAKWSNDERVVAAQLARDFFMKFLDSPIPKVCVENPVPAKAVGLPQYTQLIQPYQFGHDYSKKTCLWLKGLPKLKPTKIVDITYVTTNSGKRYTRGWYYTPRNMKARSRTFKGIADAMVTQWGLVE